MTSVRHYTDEELADYAFAPTTFVELAEVEAHLAECADCRGRLAFVNKIDGALRESIAWEIGDDIRTEIAPPPSKTLQAHAWQVDEERMQAHGELGPLLASPLRFRNERVERDPKYQTAGAVVVLYETAKELQEKQPQFALLVANAAVSLASKLALTGALRSMLRLGRAYLEQGRTLFVMGRYRDAEESLDQAEQAYDLDDDTTGWDLATVWLIRANVFVESERLSEARILATAAARQFRIFGDTFLYLNAQLLLAGVLFMEGEYRASAHAAEDVLRQSRARGDALLMGRALQNCGEAYLLLREYERAIPYYLEAYAIWDELGLEAERIRTNWSLATVETETGETESGIRRLDQTYRAFEALGIVNDAALARLPLAEVLLSVWRAEAVPDLLRNLVVSFASDGMMRNARIALAYLNEAVEQNRVSAGLIRHVRSYIERIPLQPTARFVPFR
jgi:tetratricopeptide (TPR) repeat protein